MIVTCDLNDMKLTNIRQDLSKVNWHECLYHDKCQDNYTALDRTLTNVLDKHAPPKLKRQHDSKKCEPWVTPGLRKCRQKQK